VESQKNANLIAVQILKLTYCFYIFFKAEIAFKNLNSKKESAFEFVAIKENSLLDYPRTSHGRFYNSFGTKRTIQ